MPLTNLSQLKEFLKKHEIYPKKSLSQNFLIDRNIALKILKVADIHPKDIVLEIGSGPGALTEELLHKGATVFAIEKDRTFANLLSRFRSLGRIEVIEEDFMHLHLEEMFTQIAPTSKLKVLSNTPYQISIPIITKLIPYHARIQSLTLTVQHEVAKRLIAKPKTKEYGSLSLYTQFYASIQILHKISASCFYPEPKVDSSLVHLMPRIPAYESLPENTFFSLIQSTFLNRRKMLRQTLCKQYPKEAVLSVLKANAMLDARPEELSLEQFVTLFHLLEQAKSSYLK